MADDPVSVPSLNRSLIHQFRWIQSLIIQTLITDRINNISVVVGRTSSSDSLWWKILAVLMLVTMATRFYRLHQPDEMW